MTKVPYAVAFLILLFLITTVGSFNSLSPIDSSRFERNAMIDQLERLVYVVGQIHPAWADDSQKALGANPVKRLDVPENYVIGHGDVLEVFVWRNERLSRQVVVRPDGKISLPLLQDIQAEGLTVLQLKSEITRRLGQYLNHPNVTLIVNEISSYKVSVLGRVVRPGFYPITGSTTLLEAISMAGGFTEWANKRKITVITHEGTKEKKITVDYKKIASGKDPSQNVILKRGDTIIVP